MADGIQSRFEQPMLQPVFAAKALTKTYVSGEVKVHALNNVDLQIAEKEVVVLLGPSGGGKSMLLNIMGGLDRPTSGQLFFRDSDLTVLEDRELTIYRREHVGFVFQFYNLIPSLTAYENVALVAEVTKNPMRPADVLALVGLEERKGARSQTHTLRLPSGSPASPSDEHGDLGVRLAGQEAEYVGRHFAFLRLVHAGPVGPEPGES
jgi:ABC-type sugar transport system ATPase subunit